ncbi:VirD4-like conjugal transfer protein, CD1115 family [Acetobacterium wieringae]|uniref:VirD4-like conjugal transfer protein, CD1115 family n=1 Tax=Acetobacterium wieringae TaxID=52694 RepID=UPI002B220F71|nr:type IV secretory system conjugative DNA transfer family protein [Acetobacterium wieringae]MEA4805034.1 type IV secretory system conjugative DNA transfer family protein [Acetobacterium wieringae]
MIELLKKKKKQLIFSILIVFGGAILSLYLTYNLDSLLTTQQFSGYSTPINEIIQSITSNPITRKMYLILSGVFLVFGIVFFFSNERPYHSNLNQITPDIFTPAVAGQNQHGSAKWLPNSKFTEAFDHFKLKSNDQLIAQLMRYGKSDYEVARRNLEWQEPAAIADQPVAPIKKAGMVIGKNNLRKGVEDVFYIQKDAHSLIIGSTRCGKTRTVVLQTIGALGLAGESMVMADPKGELYNYTQPYLKRLGYKVVAIDFKNPLKSDGYNFLQPIIDAVNENNLSKAVGCAWDLTRSLVGEAKGEKIWNQGEASIIASCILSVVYDNKDQPEYQNMTNVYYFIYEMCKSPDNPKDKMSIVKYMNELKETNPDHPAIGLIAISEIAPERTRGSFYTAALTTLNLFTNPHIYAMTSHSDFNPKTVGQEKTAVFIILPDEKATYYPLASLFCSQNYGTLVELADSLGGRLPIRTNFILDEFGNFTEIPDFTKQLTVGGGRGCRFNLFLQSFSQLEKVYGKEDAKTIKSNCENWIYLQADDQETLKEVSDKLDKYTTSSYSVSASQQRFASGSSSQSVNLIGRELLTPGEVAKISRPYNLVTSRNDPAIMHAPDLSGWLFNTMFGMGNEEHNIALRQLRENQRQARQETPVKLWGIWKEFELY